MAYGLHASKVRDVDFFHSELTERVQAGYIVVFPWENIDHLENMWLFPISELPQEGRNPLFIFYLTLGAGLRYSKILEASLNFS